MIVIIGFAVTFAGIAAHCAAMAWYKERKWPQINIPKMVVHLITLLFVEARLSPVEVAKKLLYLLAMLLFIISAVTGFYSRVVLNEPISGYWLMLHVTFASAFAPVMAIIAVLWAQNFRYDDSDRSLLQHIFQRGYERVTGLKPAGEALCGNFRIGQKTLFWLIILLSQPLILSVIIVMIPLFETSMLKHILEIHPYTALVFAMAVIVHTYLVVRTQLAK